MQAVYAGPNSINESNANVRLSVAQCKFSRSDGWSGVVVAREVSYSVLGGQERSDSILSVWQNHTVEGPATMSFDSRNRAPLGKS